MIFNFHGSINNALGMDKPLLVTVMRLRQLHKLHMR